MPAELATSLTATEAERLLQAESIVRDYCGWHIAPVRTAATYTTDAPQGRARLYLPTLQLVTVTDVDIVGSLTTFAAGDWTWDVAGWIEPSPGHFWPAARPGARLVVTFNHGYATVPPSVQGAVQTLAQRGTSNPGGIRREQAGPFLTDYGSLLDDSEKTALGPYVLPLV
jgi:hypothetical protein